MKGAEINSFLINFLFFFSLTDGINLQSVINPLPSCNYQATVGSLMSPGIGGRMPYEVSAPYPNEYSARVTQSCLF